MSLLTVVQEVCEVVGVVRPTALVPTTMSDRTAAEMLSLATEMAKRIAYDFRDWQELLFDVTFTGDGVKDRFPLPMNFKRMLVDGNVWRIGQMIPLVFIGSMDQWIRKMQTGTWDSRGSYIIAGDQMRIMPVLGSGVSVTFAAIDNRCINYSGGGSGDVFMNDSDTFRLDERILKLGMIWQWKANKGSPYAEDMGTWGDAMAMEGGHNQPAPVLVGTTPVSHSINARVAYPWPTP